MVPNDWDYYDQTSHNKNVTRIQFDQTKKVEYTKFPSRPKSIIAISTIKNPTIIEDELYNCEMEASGKIWHFGIYERSSPCTMFINCRKLSEIV